MADPVPRQPSRRERSPAGGPPTEAAPAVTGWGQPANRAPRDAGPPPKAPYFPPWDVAGAAPTKAGGPPRAPRGGAPAAGRGGPSQAAGPQRARPPAAAGPPGPGMPGSRSGPPPAAAVARGQGRAPARDTRNRLVIRRVNAVTVLKVSAIFYFGVLIVMIIAGTVLWNVAGALGVIDTLDKGIRSLFALSTFKLHPLVALGWTAMIGGALCFLGVVVNVFAAIMYNLISDIVGGVQVTVAADKHA